MFSNYLRIIRLAFPIILANASVPLLGLADTAAIGQTGTATDLGAIALATLIFNFVYWGFGFLRMGTTGFISQAMGANDPDEVHILLFRAILLGGAIGVLLILLQPFIGEFAIGLLNGSNEIKNLVRQYFYIRIWGAPATLISFALIGTFIGAGWTKHLMWVQLFLNSLNVLLNIIFVVGFGFGVKGIAVGTVIAEWVTLFLAAYLLLHKMKMNFSKERYFLLKDRIFNKHKLVNLFRVNGDIMIRTLALLSGFAWFANQGAAFGDPVLAANHVLLQFVSLSAFFLDGYAHVVEMLSGKAYGAKDLRSFKEQVRQSSILAGLTALLLATLIYSLGPYLIPLLTQDFQVQKLAIEQSFYAGIYISLSFAAFQLDGVFIGVTRSREMRNATILALLTFLISAYFLVPKFNNTGLWISFIIFVVARAIMLGYYYPKILNSHNFS